MSDRYVFGIRVAGKKYAGSDIRWRRNASLECVKAARENIRIARSILREQRIKTISEDVGGSMGRKIVYNNFKNEGVVYKVNVLRSGDWYPYIHRSR